MIGTLAILLLCIICIIAAAEFFTNAIEWAGYLLKLGAGATGSLLAAFGTSLPETIVPIVALMTHAADSTQIATGAVLGSSFLLLGLGGGITGVAVFFRRDRPALTIGSEQSRRDLGFFLVAFGGSTISLLFPHIEHIIWGCCLLIIYVVYVTVTLSSGGAADHMPEPLHFTLHRPERPHPAFVGLQLIASVGILIGASTVFVGRISLVASTAHLNPLVLALIIAPVATELPETLNSIIWVRSQNDHLAFGNVAGSSTFQACILGALALIATPWHLQVAGLLSVGFTLMTGLYLFSVLFHGSAKGKWLMIAAVPWVVYVILQLSGIG